MLRHLIAVSLLLAACEGLRYPHYQQVFRDPASYDMLYSASAGAINETWHLSRSINLTGLVLPSQVVSYCRAGNQSQGSWDRSPYAEDLEVSVFDGASRLVAVGRFLGDAVPGRELGVALAAVDAEGRPLSSGPPTLGARLRYTIRVAFGGGGGGGLYPWYLRRELAALSPLSPLSDQQGLAIGLSFVLV